MIQGFDIRAASSSSDSELKASFTIHAHDKAASSISYNASVPNVYTSPTGFEGIAPLVLSFA